MTSLVESLRPLVDPRLVPGLVAEIGRGGALDVVVLGDGAMGGRPMAPDALFRIASITKPMTAALALTFVADGTVELDQPVDALLPELAAPVVVRSMTGPVDDTVPASRPITLRHLLTSTNGHGFPSDFSAPVAQLLVERLLQGPPQPQRVPRPDEWMAILGRIPLLHQPGEGFTYNAAFDILGVLVARAGGAALPDLMAARLFGPLGWPTPGPRSPPGRRSDARRTTARATTGSWSRTVLTGSGRRCLVPVRRRWPRIEHGRRGGFQRMLLAGGGDVLPADLVAAMMTDQLTPAIRNTDTVFLDGQSWGWAAPSTSPRCTRGTCRAATAGSAAPAPGLRGAGRRQRRCAAHPSRARRPDGEPRHRGVLDRGRRTPRPQPRLTTSTDAVPHDDTTVPSALQ